MSKKMTYEQAYHRLQEIATQLEKGNIEIDDIEKLILEARNLHQLCKERLQGLSDLLNEN